MVDIYSLLDLIVLFAKFDHTTSLGFMIDIFDFII